MAEGRGHRREPSGSNRASLIKRRDKRARSAAPRAARGASNPYLLPISLLSLRHRHDPTINSMSAHPDATISIASAPSNLLSYFGYRSFLSKAPICNQMVFAKNIGKPRGFCLIFLIRSRLSAASPSKLPCR